MASKSSFVRTIYRGTDQNLRSTLRRKSSLSEENLSTPTNTASKALSSVVVEIGQDGAIRFLDSIGPSLGNCIKSETRRRASHITPINRPARIAFNALRRLFGENGTVGNWCRSWPVIWRVDMRPSGGPVFGQFSVRSDAIDAEQAWLAENGF